MNRLPATILGLITAAIVVFLMVGPAPAGEFELPMKVGGETVSLDSEGLNWTHYLLAAGVAWFAYRHFKNKGGSAARLAKLDADMKKERADIADKLKLWAEHQKAMTAISQPIASATPPNA
jgi:hypothetical protein